MKNHLDKIDPSVKAQAEFMKKFTQNENNEKTVSMIIFFFKKKTLIYSTISRCILTKTFVKSYQYGSQLTINLLQ